MKKRQIGRTDLYVNEIGYGSMSLSFEQNRPTEQESIKLLQRGVDECGLEFIDTADAYGQGEHDMHHGERLIAKALAGERRHRVVIATKGGFVRPGGQWKPGGKPAHLRKTCEESLLALDTDRIDLYQFHRHDPDVPVEESVGALTELQAEGKIRHIGVSNFSLPQLECAAKVAVIESIQNPLGFLFFNEERGALLEYCEQNRITWIAYAPVGGHRNAHGLPRYQEWLRENIHSSNASPYSLAIAWLLHISPNVLPIPATTKFEHLAANMRAADIALTPDDIEMMKHPRSWMEDYNESMQRNDHASAIAAMRTCLNIQPEDNNAWYNLACAYALNDEGDNAFDALDRAITFGYNHAAHATEDADLITIRSDPRFQIAMQRMTGNI